MIVEDVLGVKQKAEGVATNNIRGPSKPRHAEGVMTKWTRLDARGTEKSGRYANPR